jgi:unsaturated rhamnogalacturonyl hydrolase
MKKIILIVFIISAVCTIQAQQKPYSQQIAKTVMKVWPDSSNLGAWSKWSYDMGVVLKGFERLWKNTGDPKYFNYIQHIMDYFVNEDGSIKTYKPDEYNIDHINNGKLVLLMYKVTGKAKYLKAANLLREQLRTHPRTNEGGFWHKKIYTSQMWLDGLYMGEPFYAEYADLMHEDTAFNDVGNQFIWMESHARDTKTGLLYHGWDESKQQQWANKETGTSPLFWGRAMGWYATALVDALDWFPRDHPKRKALIDILNRLVIAVEKTQDPKTGLWLDIQHYDGPGKEKNYFEASSSSQFVYAIAKGVRKGYLPAAKISIAQKAYAGIIDQFIKVEDGQTNLHGTVKVSGLGGKPYRDGTFEYYMSEPVIVNSPIGVGAFMLASTEMDILPTQSLGKGKTVLLDNYFNNEWKKDAAGKSIRWHYTWDEMDNGGFSLFGDIWQSYGANLSNLETSPTAANLKKAAVYIIVDPDGYKDSNTPNFMDEKSAVEICDWVKRGGVLLLMTNDSANCDLQHFNILSDKFGIHFTDKSRNMVKNNEFETGAIYNNSSNPVFSSTKKMYLKEICTMDVKSPASAVITQDGDIIFAMAKYGKGTVFALGDPWIYNEYLDGRKLPAAYENFRAANEMVQWLLTQAKK